MKKIFLSFFVIVAFAIFATFSRQNVGVGLDRFLSPNTPVSNNNSSDNLVSNTNPIPDPSLTQTTPKPTTKPKPKPTPTPTPTPQGKYKDGTYTGSVADAYYGNVQVQAIIQGGKLSNVVVLQYPNDRGRSISINTQAMPYLKSEAIKAQGTNIDIVSGATDSSSAFIQSLGDALASALN